MKKYFAKTSRSFHKMRFKRLLLHFLALECQNNTGSANVTKKRRYFERNDPHNSALSVYLADFAPGGRYHDLPVDHKHHKLFRRRCSLPYAMFAQICQRIRDEEWEIPNIKHVFGSNDKPIGLCGIKMASLEVKVFCALFTLTRATPFDSMALLTNCSEEVHRKFFIQFVHHFVEKLYDSNVFMPTTTDEIFELESQYRKVGFPGCIGSTDCVHIAWDQVSTQLKVECTGKEGFATLTYSVTCNRIGNLSLKFTFISSINLLLHFNIYFMLGFIMGVSGSFFGSVNDKTIVKFEKEIDKVRSSELYTNYEYDIYTSNSGNIQNLSIQGCYLLCDNGYLNWVILQCPSTSIADGPLYHWSKRLESVRKDIECVFGRLKIRYSILKNRLRLHYKADIDKVFRVCCILHNMLLVNDGWNEYINDSSNWLFFSDLADDEIDNMFSRPRNNNDVVISDDDIRAQINSHGSNGVTFDGTNYSNNIVHSRSRDELRQLLVKHFEIAYNKNEIAWMNRRYNI